MGKAGMITPSSVRITFPAENTVRVSVPYSMSSHEALAFAEEAKRTFYKDTVWLEYRHPSLLQRLLGRFHHGRA